MRSLVVGLLCALLLSACAAGQKVRPYVAPSVIEAPPQQTTVLKLDQSNDDYAFTGNLQRGLYITSVDGASVGGFLVTSFPTEVRLPAGKHNVKIAVTARGADARGISALWFPGEAGKTYIAKYDLSSRWTYTVWIEEESNGMRVGGLGDFPQ